MTISDQPILIVKDLTVMYDNVLIVKNISFDVKDIKASEGCAPIGQSIAILGASGRGKSTIFKAITGLLKPNNGEVLILKDNPAEGFKIIQEGDVGFVDQKYTLFEHKTVFETLNYALRNSKLNDLEKKTLINEKLESWSLIHQKNKYPFELSGGQKQRTAILEQLMSSKRYIVFDEPASGLDVANIKKLKQSFEHIIKQEDLNTIIFSTHDINLAVELADFIIVIGYKEKDHLHSEIVGKFVSLGLTTEYKIDLVKKIENLIINH